MSANLFNSLFRQRGSTGSQSAPADEGQGSPADNSDVVVPFRSNAAEALAAAVAHGDAGAPTPAPVTVGRLLTEDHSNYVVNEHLPGESQPPLQVTPITVIKTAPKLELHNQIAVNAQYICYGLKQGHIRLLNKETGDRTLLKGHTTTLADVSFEQASSNVLASADGAGGVFLRSISEAGGSFDDKILYLANATSDASVKLAFYPEQHLLAYSSTNSVNIVSTNTPEPTPTALPLPIPSPITALAFCPTAPYLAAGTESGDVHIWEIPSPSPAPSPAPFLTFRPFPSAAGPVTSLTFFPAPPSSPHPTILQAATASNTRLALFPISPSAPSPPAPSSTLILSSSAAPPPALFNHLSALSSLNLSVLANSLQPAVYTVHLTPTPDSTSLRFSYLCQFSVAQPILTLTTSLDPPSPPAPPSTPPSISLFCIQPEAIQQYTLDPSLCVTPSLAPTPEPSAAPPASPPSTPTPPPVPTPATTEAAAPTPSQIPAPVRLLNTPTSRDRSTPSTPSHAQPEPAQSPSRTTSQSTEDPLIRLLLRPPSTTTPRSPQAPSSPPPPVAEPSPTATPPTAASPTPPAPTEPPPTLTTLPIAKSAEPSTISPPFPESTPAASSSAKPTTPTTTPRAAAPAPSADTTPTLAPAVAPPLIPMATSSAPREAPAPPGIPRPPSPSKVDSAAADAASAERGTSLEDVEDILVGLQACMVLMQGEVQKLQRQVAAAPLEAAEAAGKAAAEAAACAAKEATAAAVKGVRDEVQSALKASQNATVQAVEAALVKQARRAEEDRRRAAAAERKELEKLITGVTAEVGRVRTEVDKSHAALAASVTAQVDGAVRAAVAAAVPEQSASLQVALHGALVREVKASVAEPMLDAMRAAFADALVPKFEAGVREMFAQVEKALGVGLAGTLHQISTASAASSAAASSLAKSTSQLGALVTTLEQGDAAEKPKRTAAKASKEHKQVDPPSAAKPPKAQPAAPAPPAKPAAPMSVADIEKAMDRNAAAAAAAAQLMANVPKQADAPDATPAPANPLAKLMAGAPDTSAPGDAAVVAATPAAPAAPAAPAVPAPAPAPAAPAPAAVPAARPMTVEELEARHDPHAKVKALVREEKFQEAFITVLKEHDTATLLWLIQQLPPSQFLSRTPAPLSQDVLLPLLQHIAEDLQVETELKLRWISEVAALVDPSAPSVAPYVPTVCGDALSALKALIKKIGHESDLGGRAKAGIHALNSLIYQAK